MQQFDTGLNFGNRFSQRLSLLERYLKCELFGSFFEKLSSGMQHSGPLDRRECGKTALGFTGCPYRGCDLRAVNDTNGRDLLTV